MIMRIRPKIIRIFRVFLNCLLLGALASCTGMSALPQSVSDQTSISGTREGVKSIPLGASASSIMNKLGPPQRVFNHSNDKLQLLFYCIYGFSADYHAGFWVDSEYGYYELDEGTDLERRANTATNALWMDKSAPVSWDCHTRTRVNWSLAPKRPDKRFGWETENFNIDLLQIKTETQSKPEICATGKIHKITVTGQISPDSSFAMSRLLDRLSPCKDSNGRDIVPVTISLRSGGGLLDDGYLMGEIFRRRNVTTAVENGNACASSCAVAFLGGKKRIVEDKGVIMYHAPYFTGENVYGKRDINCEVGKEALDELNAYYRKMTDAETGDRLFERTMWYCSAEDGWVVQGGAAAELYGIATEK